MDTNWFFLSDMVAKASTNVDKVTKALDSLVADDVLTIMDVKAENGRELKFYEHSGALVLRKNKLEQEIQEYIIKCENEPDGSGLYDTQVIYVFANANKLKITKKLIKYEDLGYIRNTMLHLDRPDGIPAWMRAYAPKCRFCAGHTYH